ncbi:MAG: 2-dehydro-3-deoxygalactonokinase [Pseudomonadota bacterium]
MVAPCLIGLDWGSTALRAFLMGANGEIIEQRTTQQGCSTTTDYSAVLREVSSGWPEVPVLACGMVGSAHGWREVPYSQCPASEAALARGAAQVASVVWIVPGLRCDPEGAPPDVMRGEETQVFGALATSPDWARRSCIVLPGTHSKWVHVEDARIASFATYLTGELYAVLRTHSVLGRLMPDGAADPAAFAAGVDAARYGDKHSLSHQLFAVRTLGLTGQMPAAGLADYLSGLLIGHELQAGLAWRAGAGLSNAPLVLVGDDALCARYDSALRRFGATAALLPNSAPAGLWRIANALEIVQ